MFIELGHGGRQPDRDAARQAARRAARPDRRRHDARRGLPAGQHVSRAGHRHRRRDDAVPRHRRSLHASTGARRRDALFDRDDRARPTRPSPSAASARGGQAAAFTYDLAQSIVYTRQGNPAWAGQERDGATPDPLRRPVLRRRAAPDCVDLRRSRSRRRTSSSGCSRT